MDDPPQRVDQIGCGGGEGVVLPHKVIRYHGNGIVVVRDFLLDLSNSNVGLRREQLAQLLFKIRVRFLEGRDFRPPRVQRVSPHLSLCLLILRSQAGVLDA
ncbi:MAG: hypothetical protein ACI9MR_002708, partial [Myxococcota bacterium]